MKRFLLKFLFFLLLIIPSYPIYLFFVGSIPKIRLPNFHYLLGEGSAHSFNRFREAKEFTDIDVLFLGSSLAYRGFDVRVFEKYGLKSFVLGAGGIPPNQVQFLLDRYLRSLNPKVIVYGISPERFLSDGVGTAIDIMSNDRIDNLSIKMAMKLNHIKVYNTLIYGSIRQFFKMDSNFSQPLQIDTQIYISGGYVEINESRDVNGERKKPESAKEQRFRQDQIDAFSGIVSGFKYQGQKYILLRPPVTKDDFYRFNNDEFDALMHKSGHYYDFNEILNFTDDYFLDFMHLTQEGAEIFSRTVAELILSLNIFETTD